MFAGHEIKVSQRVFAFCYESPEDWLEVFKALYGPANRVFASLDSPKQAEFLICSAASTKAQNVSICMLVSPGFLAASVGVAQLSTLGKHDAVIRPTLGKHDAVIRRLGRIQSEQPGGNALSMCWHDQSRRNEHDEDH
jgi:hypothetical protein